MLRLISVRFLHALPLLALVTFVAFGLSAVAPIDPARMALSAGGTGVRLTETDVAAKRVELGLDKPLPDRFGSWWSGVMRWDFGTSYWSNRPVSDMLKERIPPSLALATLAVLLSTSIAMPLGMLAAVRRGAVDLIVRVVSISSVSLPGFWLALLGIWLFAVQLHWVPSLGSLTPTGILLPAITLALGSLGRMVRLMRTTTLDVLGSDYVQVARSKGLVELTILRRHVFRNALVPVLAVIGLDFTGLLANAAVVEWVFAWPGLGRMGVEAALAADLPVLMAFVLLVGWAVVVVNLLVDLLYGIVDPRLRETAV